MDMVLSVGTGWGWWVTWVQYVVYRLYVVEYVRCVRIVIVSSVSFWWYVVRGAGVDVTYVCVACAIGR